VHAELKVDCRNQCYVIARRALLTDCRDRPRALARMRSPSKNKALSAPLPTEAPTTRMVIYQCESEVITGFLALPYGPGRHRAVIVVHEWWGLNGWVKAQAMKLAAHAYVALALDLYQGEVTVNPPEARKLKRAVSAGRAIREMKSAFDYLAHRPDVDPTHIGSIGWSMGGSWALQLAIHEPRLTACVVNYGSLPTNPSDLGKINARVLGIFGSRDRGVPPHKVRAFEQRMHSMNKPVEIQTYEGAGHAFENPANKSGYRPAAAADAWLRTLTFFEESL